MNCGKQRQCCDVKLVKIDSVRWWIESGKTERFYYGTKGSAGYILMVNMLWFEEKNGLILRSYRNEKNSTLRVKFLFGDWILSFPC